MTNAKIRVMMRLLIDMIEDKFPYYWSLPDGNGVHTVKKRKPSDKEVARLIVATFGYDCTELDVYMVRGKYKLRAKMLKKYSPDPEDVLEMVNYYAAPEDCILPKRKKIPRWHSHFEKKNGLNTPTLEIMKYLIAKGDVNVK